MSYQKIRDWAIAILATFGAFLLAGAIGAFVAARLGRWDLPASGFTAAFAVVLTAYIAAPSKSLTCAISAFVIGAAISVWLFWDGSFYPEQYESLAYQPTYLPLWFTLSGGILGVLCALVLGAVSAET